jgi:hypothetical protein
MDKEEFEARVSLFLALVAVVLLVMILLAAFGLPS